MYPCIIAPVDGTPFGEHAVPVAASIARHTGAQLWLAHVHVPLIAATGAEAAAFGGAWLEQAKEAEQGYLEELEERVERAYGVRPRSALIDGSVAAALEGFVRGCGAGLVVMSTHGHVRLRRLWHHGVAEALARRLPVPVLLVRPRDERLPPPLDPELELRHVLVPLDGTRYSEGMLEHAISLGRAFHARYTLLRVVAPDDSGYGALARGRTGAGPALQRRLAAARQYLNAIAERMRAAGLEVRTAAVPSDVPAEAILQYSRSAASPFGPVDIVAMEMHPHRAVARIFGSHTADRVLHDTPVPLLLLEPDPARPAARPTRRPLDTASRPG